MKVLLDTNVFYSILLHPNPRMDALISHLLQHHQVITPTYVVDELYEKVLEKRPTALNAVREFIDTLEITTINIPETKLPTAEIRDPNDRPILLAALALDIDMIISGDGHFKELEMERPRIMDPGSFIREFVYPDE